MGALRDVVQNHLLQVMALLAMDPPVGTHADAFRDEKVRVFRATKAADTGAVVRGQYTGYRDEAGVAPGSDVETFAALRLEIESWRWAGVPFLLRAGKRLATTALEAVVEFHEPPRLLFSEPDSGPPHPNHLRLRLGGGNEGAELSLQAKVPGETLSMRSVPLAFSYEEEFGGDQLDAYERLVLDAVAGNRALFARQDGWRNAGASSGRPWSGPRPWSRTHPGAGARPRQTTSPGREAGTSLTSGERRDAPELLAILARRSGDLPATPRCLPRPRGHLRTVR